LAFQSYLAFQLYSVASGDAVLARQIRALRPGLVLLRNPYDLLFREPRSLPLSVLLKRRTLNPRGGKSLRQVSHHSPVEPGVIHRSPADSETGAHVDKDG
jgi:hypothetical protein